MRKAILATLATATVALGSALAFTTIPASATENEPPFETCDNLTGWYVNPDETDRKPVPTEAGLRFEGNNLIHHAADLPLGELKEAGASFILADGSAAPDQPSFFSVEVRNGTDAYGTLRWNPDSGKWSIVIGPGTDPIDGDATAGAFEDSDPVALLTDKVTKWGAFDPATAKVVSFGVGYTANPPGTVPTVVSKVSFNGTTYDLTCTPQTESPSPTPSETVSPSPSETASPSPSGTMSPSPSSGAGGGSPTPTQPTDEATPDASPTASPGGELALTGEDTNGVNVPLVGSLIGVIAISFGAALFLWARRRATEEQ